jgi:tetratricopeptide (TPR) repeat protein
MKLRNLERHLLVILLCAGMPAARAGSARIDSLYSAVATAVQDTDRATTLVQLCYELRVLGRTDEALDCGKKALELSEKIGWKRGQARAYNNIGVVYANQGDYPRALSHYLRSLSLAETLKDPKVLASVYGNMGNLYMRQEDYEKALRNYFLALDMATQMKNKSRMAIQLGNIGIVYYQQGLAATGPEKDSLYSKALGYYGRALALDQETGYENGVCADYGNIGMVYDERGEYEKAVSYFLKAKELAVKLGNLQYEANNLANLGTVYTRQKKFRLAEECLLKALAADRKADVKEGVKNVTLELSQLYEAEGNYMSSYQYYQKFVAVRDSLVNEENTKKQTQAEMQYVFSKKQAADSIRNAEQVRQEELKHEQEVKQQQAYTIGGAIGFLLMLLVAGVSFRAYRQKQKANEIISEQKLIVEEKQKEILDSIYYARRIQRSLLPSERYIERVLDHLKKG